MTKSRTLAILAIPVLFAARGHSFACGGLLCPELPATDSAGLKAMLLERIRSSPSCALVEPPRSDTAEIDLDPRIDSICPISLKVVTYRTRIIPLSGKARRPRFSILADTIDYSISCPNRDCVREYSCSPPAGIGIAKDAGKLRCQCERSISTFGRMGGGWSCESDNPRLGINAGGILFEPGDLSDERGLAWACPTDILGDAWIPVEGDSVRIRAGAPGRVRVLAISLKELLD